MLSHDPTLRSQQLAQLIEFELQQRVRSHDDPWARLCNGELTAEKAVALARERDPERNERDLWYVASLFTRPSVDRQKREREQVLAALDEELADSGDHEPLEFSPRPRLSTAAAGLAAAAALVLMLRPDEPEPPVTDEPTLPSEPLPSYQLAWRPSGQTTLGPAPAPGSRPDECTATFHRELMLSAELRPNTAVSQPVTVRAWAVSRDGERPLDIEQAASIDRDGFIAVKQPISELELAPGKWTITFVVGPKSRLESVDSLSELKALHGPDMQILRDSVCVIE